MRAPFRAVAVALGLLVCAVASGAASGASSGDEARLTACREGVERAPDDLAAYTCWVRLAAAMPRDDAEAFARIVDALERRRAAAGPDSAETRHATLTLGRVLARRGDARGDALLAEAIEDYAAAGEWRDEALARTHRMRMLTIFGPRAEAAAEGERARQAAEASGDFRAIAGAALEVARLALVESDAGRAWEPLRRIERDPRFAELSPDFRGNVLSFLAMVAGHLDLVETSQDYRARLLELADVHALTDWQAEARSERALIAQRRDFRGGLSRAGALELARQALEFAEADTSEMAGPARFVARLRVASLTGGREGLDRLARLAEEVGPDGPGTFHVRMERGTLFLDDPAVADLERAREEFHGALEAAQRSGSPRDRASAWTRLATAELAAAADATTAAAIDRALEALDAIERLHAGQSGDRTAALVFARFAPMYARVVDALLRRGRVDEAFAVSERMRARTLLDRLGRAGIEPAAAPPATAEAVRAALAPDEALLAFVLGADDDDPTWLLVVTADGVAAHARAPRVEVEAAARFWLGLIRRRDAGEGAGARRLHELLLGDALDALPAGTRRLVVVPDGVLHRIPFDLLRRAADAPPLVEPFELSLVGSAALRLRLGARVRTGSAGETLFLADPASPSAPAPAAAIDGAAGVDAGARAEGGRLPWARVEARRALEALGGAGELLLDGAATEAALARADFARFGALHLAAHAVVDDRHPERSAVLLAPDPGGADGRLEPAEIGALRLGGALVTLSACRSAGGETLAGEGVFGLARAFFAADAGAVVGSLWPVRDEETARLMDGFYRRLAAGETVGAALAGAKRARFRAGDPAEAWAGFVALGAVDRSPVRPGRAALPPARRAAAVLAGGAALLLLLAAALPLRRRRRRRAANRAV